jgi:hypothetical protein
VIKHGTILSRPTGRGEDDRSWRWWDSTVTAADNLRVEVEIDGWPFGSGALRWLVRAAGAVDLVEH